MEEFLGKEYILISSENFEDYLAFMGVNGLHRKIAVTLKPTQRLTRNEDGTYSFIFKSKLANSNTKFKLGEEFEETKADGVKVQAFITFEGNKMIHIQKEKNGITSKHVREFYTDKLVITTTAEGFDKTVTRLYELVK